MYKSERKIPWAGGGGGDREDASFGGQLEGPEEKG